MNKSGDDQPEDSRRRVLTYAALAALGGTGIAGAWTLSQPDAPSDPAPAPPEAIPESVPELVARHAPDLYFGALEKWFPTDPQQYAIETVGGSVVDGYTALNGYTTAFNNAGTPPDPVVFYRVVEAAEGVDAIQYWMYSVFDQFTVNFHWHDWELLQVFVDRETGTPLLLSASAHSRASPNNEFLDPDLSGDRRPAILAEVGSHSSASELNDRLPSFERLPTDDWRSDVTNDLLDISQSLSTPFAYGLPRDEGARLPFVMPELDGYRLDQHPSLSVDREDFIDERVTVDSWRGLPRPPTDLPLREPGLVITSSDSPTESDATYRLLPMASVRETVDDFVGPQLGFEFAIPGFAEELYASHITSVGIPWEQPRYTDPLADVTDPAHRQRIDGERPAGLLNRVVGSVRYLGSGSDGALNGVPAAPREALDGLVDVSLYDLPTEVAVRLASDPEATVTRNGVFGLLHVDSGEHQLVVNGPGFAPLAQRFVHEGGLFQAGAGGELTLIATEDAGWIRGDGRETNGIAHIRVVEDYAGVVYDGRPAEDDRFAVAVHRAGRYTVEIEDTDGRLGAYRVGPDSFDEEGNTIREGIDTGKQSLITTLVDELRGGRELARSLADGEENEILNRLSRAQEEAAAAATAAERGDGRTADRQLSTVSSLLMEALEILSSEDQRAYSDAAVAALEPRFQALIDRAESAADTELSP
ncbi:hypothetical protein [Halohasta litchfieldiae]|jgi:hypothetical protein|nr:hypothetical protein [Halohasta litchfieldiae]